MNLGFDSSSAIIITSLGPAGNSVGVSTSFFAIATNLFPGPTIFETDFIVSVP